VGLRYLLGAAACLLCAVLLLGAFVAHGTDAVISTVGSSSALVVGPAGRRVSCSFLLVNASDSPIQPAVLWLSCNCEPCGLPTRPVEPGAQFEARCRVEIPTHGALSLEYVIGATGAEVSNGCRIVVVAHSDGHPTLAVQPEDCMVSLPPEDEQEVDLEFEVAYRLAPGSTADPERDLDVRIPGFDVIGIRVQDDLSGDPQWYAGHLRVAAKASQALSPGDVLRGFMASPGAPPVALNVHIGRRW